MTSSRPYRSVLSDKEAIRKIEEGKGSQFDPELVETFIEVVSKTLPMEVVSETTPDEEEPNQDSSLPTMKIVSKATPDEDEPNQDSSLPTMKIVSEATPEEEEP